WPVSREGSLGVDEETRDQGRHLQTSNALSDNTDLRGYAHAANDPGTLAHSLRRHAPASVDRRAALPSRRDRGAADDDRRDRPGAAAQPLDDRAGGHRQRADGPRLARPRAVVQARL